MQVFSYFVKMFRLFIQYTRIYRTNYLNPTNNYILSFANVVKQNHRNHFASIDFVNSLSQKLNCPKHDAANILTTHPEFKAKKLSDISENLDLLLNAGVTPKTILDNLSILAHDTGNLIINLQTLNDMKPNNINDFAPLLGTSTSKLLKIKKIAKAEENDVPQKNRIYYLSHLMKIEPIIISKYLCKHLFVLQLPYTTFNEILTIILKYIAPVDILHDLLIFRYSPTLIESRLVQAKIGHKTKLMPWMVRCLETKLLKSIKLSSDEKAILGEKSLVEYLSNRLQLDIQTVETMIKKHPKVMNVRATRMKEILDYLLDEAGHTPLDIAQVPRIFCHSLKTTKKRLNELQSHGCRPQSLTVVCKSANEYRKFLRSWINIREPLKEQNDMK